MNEPLTLPKGFRPMKGEAAELSDVRFPCIASPKIDGFRCIVGPGGVALTASLKPIPNQFVQDYFKEHRDVLEGLDGELVVGDPTDPEIFDKTNGALRRKHGEPDFTFWVFDCWEWKDRPFRERSDRIDAVLDVALNSAMPPVRVRAVESYRCYTATQLQDASSQAVSDGYEGLMVRSPDGPYKFGRSTVKEGYLLKIKEFWDHEAVIIGIKETQTNLNPKKVNERGLSERSSHKENKVGRGSLGGFLCRGLNGPFAGKEFTVSTGVLTKAQREDLWRGDRTIIGDVLTYKHMKHSGGYEKPRHAGFLRFRPEWDISE